jgi:hypothetical protein
MGSFVPNKGGVVFITLLKNSFGQFMNLMDSEEQYLMGMSVQGIEYVNQKILVAMVDGKKEF